MDEKNSLLSTSEENDRQCTSVIKGISLLFIVAVLFSTSVICAQVLDRAIPDLQLSAIRNALPLIGLLSWTAIRKNSLIIPREHIKGVIMYTLLLCSWSICIFTAASLIPLATETTIYKTTFIISGLLIYRIFNKEEILFHNILSSIISLTGILLVLQPDFIFGEHHDLGSLNGTTTTTIEGPDPYIGIGISILAGVVMASEIAVYKYYPYLPNMSNQQIYYNWTFFTCMAISIVGSLIFESPIAPSDLDITQWLVTLAHTLAYCTAEPCLVHASSLVPGNTVSLVLCTSMVFVVLAQYTFLKELHPGNRNWKELLGAALVLIGSILSPIIGLCRDRYSKGKQQSCELIK